MNVGFARSRCSIDSNGCHANSNKCQIEAHRTVTHSHPALVGYRGPYAPPNVASMSRLRTPFALGATLVLLGPTLLHCSGSSTPAMTPDAGPDAFYLFNHAPIGVDASPAELDMCFPDHDGLNGGNYIFDVTVDDTGFSKMIFATQNDATATLTLKNTGTKPHGFAIECTSVTPAYPTVPKGCPDVACFPSNAYIAPLAPGESKTVTFGTPTPDGLLYPVRSSEPNDDTVPGLNGAMTQWSLM
jgi:hypothetical protein